MIRLLIVDDHKVVRQGLRFLLQHELDIEIVGEAADGEQAVAAVRQHVPTVVLLDLLMPKMDGLAALRSIKEISPSTQVIILTSHQGDDGLFEAIKAGALSYVLKTAGVDVVVESVRAAARGPNPSAGAATCPAGASPPPGTQTNTIGSSTRCAMPSRAKVSSARARCSGSGC